MDAKEMLTTCSILLPILVLCLCSSASARPGSLNMRSAEPNQRSAESNQQRAQSETDLSGVPVYFVDVILRDHMIRLADADNDDKLSASEITWYFRYPLRYTQFVARQYGTHFIDIADMDGDGLLNPIELLVMLIEMNTSSWARR